MDSDRLPLRKRKDVPHGAVRDVPLRQSVEQPCLPREDEASVAKSFEASKSLDLSVNAGVTKVSAEGGVSSSGSSSITLSKGSAFAYGLVKIKWDANQKKNKTKIVKLTDDQ
jgi:hypothetical protein